MVNIRYKIVVSGRENKLEKQPGRGVLGVLRFWDVLFLKWSDNYLVFSLLLIFKLYAYITYALMYMIILTKFEKYAFI